MSKARKSGFKEYIKHIGKRYSNWAKRSEKSQEKWLRKGKKIILKHEEVKFSLIVFLLIVSVFWVKLIIDVMWSMLFFVINSQFYQSFLGLFLLTIFIVAFVMSWSFISELYKKFYNPFIALSFAFLVGLIYFGYIAVQIIYPSGFQYFIPTITTFPTDNVSANLTCTSWLNRDVPSVSDYMYCNVTITNDFINDLTIEKIKRYDRIVPSQNYSENEYPCNLLISSNQSRYCFVYFPIGDSGVHEYQFNIPISIPNQSLSYINTNFYHYPSLTDTDYNSRTSQKYTLLVTIVIGAIFSTFTAIKNLMDIWDRKKRKK